MKDIESIRKTRPFCADLEEVGKENFNRGMVGYDPTDL